MTEDDTFSQGWQARHERKEGKGREGKGWKYSMDTMV